MRGGAGLGALDESLHDFLRVDRELEDGVERSALLDRYCDEIGRDPAEITRSIFLPVSYDDPGTTRDAAAAAVEAGFSHLVLGLPAPWPTGVARWVADEVVAPSRAAAVG